MKSNFSKIFIIFIFVFILLSSFSVCLAADTPADDAGDGDTTAEDSGETTETLQLQIPIFDYSEATSLPEYISNIFKYAMIIIVPLAIIMIMIGGIQWIMAAGNSQKIGAAKTQITSAFLGLVLGLLTYTLLSFVGITQLYMPGVERIGPDEGMPLIPESQGTATATYSSVGGECFPVTADSFQQVSWNWGGRRSSGGRCHAGIDIYTKGSGTIVAIAPGKVTSVGHFYNCKRGSVDRVIINHGTYSVNYGEIDTGKIASGITPGAQVTAGQVLGVATRCGMLHMELYQGSVSSNSTWYPPKGQSVGAGNYCRDNYLATKPAVLQDPTNTIKGLQGKMCGPK
jgi:hypothetical protein